MVGIMKWVVDGGISGIKGWVAGQMISPKLGAEFSARS
jgi:hypothetical protein